MIVADKPLNVETSTNITTSNFRIKASKKAFEILSSGLYSNKTKAIIRELSTNAYDSHVSAGKADEPIEVKLPNSLEPYFSVKDNGVGLSPDQIENIYTTYFASDKTNSNELTGCLGLGSKSPFSYTDQFTVETRFNGVRYTYNAHMDAEGLPAIALFGQSPTNECNGVEVKFPVKAADFNDFIYNAADVLRWFSVSPNVKGSANFAFEKREYMRKTDKYGILLKNHYNSSHVVMGNVAYHVSYNDIRNCSVELSPLERKVLEWGCDLFVPIGTLDITANREKVSYDKASATVLKNCLAAAVEDIRAEVDNIIAKAPTIWQARRALYDAQHSILGQVKSLVDVTWGGNKIYAAINIDSSSGLDCQTLMKRNSKYKKVRSSTVVADGNFILVNDMKHGGYSRAIAFAKDKNLDLCYILECPIPNVLQTFLKETGIEEVCIRTSTLPKPERNQSLVPRRPAVVKAKLNKYVETCRSNVCADYWEPADVDLSAGGIYVEISYFRYKKTMINSEGIPVERTYHPEHMQNIVDILRQMGYQDKVYGVRSGDVPALNKRNGWTELGVLVQKILKDNEDLLIKAQMIQNWMNLENKNYVTCFLDRTEGLKPDSLFGQFLSRVAVAVEVYQDQKAKVYLKLIELTDKVIPENPAVDFNELRNGVYAKYPLLQYLNWYNSNSKEMREAVVEYVKAVDAK